MIKKEKDLKYKNYLWYYEDKLFTGQAINSNGTKVWYKEGKYHRDNDLPAIDCSNGDKYWYKEGKSHRETGPAIEYSNGNKYWYHNDEKIDCKDNKEFLRIIKLLIFK